MKVILLGAGASKAYAQSPTGVRMPIAKDFFDTFDKLAISANPWVLQDGILDFITREYNTNPYDYLRSGLDIENFHSDIEDKLIKSFEECQNERGENHIIKLANFKAYNQLIYIFSSVINEIQNGPTSASHVALAKLLNPDDTIITFNWDTLMDRALQQEKSWTTDNGYSFKAHKIYRDQWVKPDANNKNNAPTLIKLHGSTNWLTSHPIFRENEVILTQESPPESVFVYESAQKPYSCHAGRYMDGYSDLAYGYYPVNLDDAGIPAPKGKVILRATMKTPWMPEGISDSAGLTSIPLIIPPVKNKKYSFYGDLFTSLWEKAELALRLADEIIIIGYSFPRTDHRSNSLFMNAFLSRSDMPRVKILDPSPEKIADKFTYEYGIKNTNITIYKDYFSESFDLHSLFSK